MVLGTSAVLGPLRTARSDNGRWAAAAQTTTKGPASEPYNDDEYEDIDCLSPPEDNIPEPNNKKRIALSDKKKEPNARSRYDFDGYESDYGTTGAPIGRTLSRRFGNRSRNRNGPEAGAGAVPPLPIGTRREEPSGLQHQQQRDLASPEPAAPATRGGGYGAGMLDLPIRRASSSASKKSRRWLEDDAIVRKGPSSGKPRLSFVQGVDDTDAFEVKLSRLGTSGTGGGGGGGGGNGGPSSPRLEDAYSKEEQIGEVDMVEIPIRDDTGSPEMNTRSRSLTRRTTERTIPPHAMVRSGGGEDRGGGTFTMPMMPYAMVAPVPPPKDMPPHPSSNGKGDGDDDDDDAATQNNTKTRGFRLVAVVFALALSVFLVGLDINIVSAAIPRITSDFSSQGDIGWYGSAFLMNLCAFQILFGRLYTHFPPKFVFVAALFVFEVGSLVAGLAPSSAVLIFGRGMQGVGCAGMLSGALVVGALAVPLGRRPLLAGVIGATEGVAMIGAPMIGGALTERASWRWCFHINLPLGAMVIAIILFFLRLPPQPAPAPDLAIALPEEKGRGRGRGLAFATKLVLLVRKLDLLGTALLIPIIAFLLLALQLGGKKYDWGSLGIICLFVLSGVMFGVFCWLQHQRQDRAMVPTRIFKQRSILAGFFFMICTSSALTVIAYFLPLWFQVVLQASPSSSGIRMLPMLFGVAISVVTSGCLVSVIGYYAPFMLLGSGLMSIGAGLLSSWRPDTPNASLVLFPIMFGTGIGLSLQQPIVAAQTVLRDRDVPLATSVIVLGQSLGAAVAMAVADAIFSNRLSVNIREHVGLRFSTQELARTSPPAVTQTVLKSGGSLTRLTLAYNASITQAFLVALAMACLSIFGALAAEWRSVKEEEKRRRAEESLAKSEQGSFHHAGAAAGAGGAGSSSRASSLRRRRPQSMPYDADGRGSSSPFTIGGMHDHHHPQQQGTADAPQPYDSCQKGESPYGDDLNEDFWKDHLRSDPYEKKNQQQQQQQQRLPGGLGLSTSYYGGNNSPTPTYYEKAPIRGG